MNDQFNDTGDKKLRTADFLPGGGQPASEGTAGIAAAAATSREGHHDESSAPLFAGEESQRFRANWRDVQAAFVDEPRKAVEQADQLVAETIQSLARVFADERAKLEHEWSRGEDKVSTEDLRLALRRYRSFFDRLLSV